MPTIGWDDETRHAQASQLAVRHHGDYPGDEPGPPIRDGEVEFRKITSDGRRYLHVLARVDGQPARFLLGRDDIERLRAFLG